MRPMMVSFASSISLSLKPRYLSRLKPGWLMRSAVTPSEIVRFATDDPGRECQAQVEHAGQGGLDPSQLFVRQATSP